MTEPSMVSWLDSTLTWIRTAIDGLCPILGTVNLRRRNTDTGDSSNAFKAILVRAVASAAVAVVLGCASGLLSAYIMVQVMQVRVDNVNMRITETNGKLIQESYDRQRLEDRLNNHLERVIK